MSRTRDRDTYLWVKLAAASGAGPATVSKLLQRFHRVAAIFSAPAEEFSGSRRFAAVHKALHDPDTDARARHHWATIAAGDFDLITRADPNYPRLLRESRTPPTLLFVRGHLPVDTPSVAIVGSRTPSQEGAEIAYHWARSFAQSGLSVVSGMAQGIDSAAHRGALAAGGHTVAVLGCGLNHVQAHDRQALIERILASGGAVVSQFWPLTAPEAGLFPRRNGTIAGLSQAVLVVEAARESGALHTASHARANRRKLYAVPGPLSRSTCEGSNRLLSTGACAALEPRQVVRELLGREPVVLRRVRPRLPADLEEVYALLHGRGQHIDELAASLKMPPALLLQRLLRLELAGVVRQLPGKRFALAEV
jgi:DNA processing protein